MQATFVDQLGLGKQSCSSSRVLDAVHEYRGSGSRSLLLLFMRQLSRDLHTSSVPILAPLSIVTAEN